MDFSFGVVELKYEQGKLVIVKIEWIIGLKPKYSKTQDFFCYWSPDFNDSPELNEYGYSKHFTGLPSLFKVFVVHLTNSVEEAQKYLEGRIKMMPKRFREPGDTEEEVKKMETKKKRNAKKELKEQIAEAHAKNSEYLFTNMSTLSANDFDKKKETGKMRSELPNIATSIPVSQHPIAFLPADSIEEFENDIIIEDLQETQGTESTFVLETESVKTKDTDSFKQQSDQPLPSDISYEMSDEEYIKSNELPVVQQLFLLSTTDLCSCSSYEEYVETLMNGQGQLNLTEGNTETEEIHETPNNNEHDCPDHVVNNPDLMLDEEKSNTNESGAFTVAKTMIMVDGQNVVTMNFDELKKEILELKKKNLELKKENEALKIDLESANKRNLLLQNYLVIADERLGQTIFIEKDGGRLYRGGVFLNKNQCAVLDKSKNDREFLNNLVTSIFGRKVLETSSITGAPSNRMKGKNVAESSSDASVAAYNDNPKQKLKLDPDLLQLTYDIMDARSITNKTPKMTKTAKNVIIGKKCTNAATAADVAAAKANNP